jgi:hypothetical protein
MTIIFSVGMKSISLTALRPNGMAQRREPQAKRPVEPVLGSIDDI